MQHEEIVSADPPCMTVLTHKPGGLCYGNGTEMKGRLDYCSYHQGHYFVVIYTAEGLGRFY